MIKIKPYETMITQTIPKFKVHKFFGWIPIFDENLFEWRTFWSRNFCTKAYFSEKFLDTKKFKVQKIWSKSGLNAKFGQNWFSSSWDIADMDKCHQVKCCLNKCHYDSWHQLKTLKFGKKWVSNSWDKIKLL